MAGKHQEARRTATRAKYAGTEPAAANDIPPGAVVVATAAQLSHLVSEALTRVVEETGFGRAPAGAPRQLTRHELAAELQVSIGMIDVLRRRGMPFRKVGDSPRYELQACLDWLDQNQDANTEAEA
jgi:hypothetical protein